MNNNDEKVNIKLQRHKWPDEIRKERAGRRRKGLLVVLIVCTFGLGALFGNSLGGGITPNSSSNLQDIENVYQTLLNEWYFGNEMDNEAQELINNAIFGMLELNGDPYTAYLTTEQVQEMNNSINMSYEGIGVGYQVIGDNFVITKIYRDTPADKAGIQVGDILYSVDGDTIEDVEVQELSDRITGGAGTEVNVGVIRGNEIVTFDMQRSSIDATAWGKVIDGNIGYLEISSFGMDLGSVVEGYLKEFKAQGVTRLIIDMRGNSGGYLSAINDVSKLFFEEGATIYSEQFKSGQTTTYNVKNSKKDEYKFDNTVVMINENSASAAEVLAIAFKENTTATLVGNTSFGKGTVQTTDLYDNGTALKVTIAKWFSPDGNNIHGEGVEPNELVKLHEVFYTGFGEFGEDEVTKYDSISDGVIFAQQGLSYLGLYNGRTDGYYDEATLKGIEAFNAKYNYSGTDITMEKVLSIYQAVVVDYNTNLDTKDIQLIKAIEIVEA